MLFAYANYVICNVSTVRVVSPVVLQSKVWGHDGANTGVQQYAPHRVQHRRTTGVHKDAPHRVPDAVNTGVQQYAPHRVQDGANTGVQQYAPHRVQQPRLKFNMNLTPTHV